MKPGHIGLAVLLKELACTNIYNITRKKLRMFNMVEI
jgi:hypothetical protein